MSSMALCLGSSQQVALQHCAGTIHLERMSGDIQFVGGSRDDLVRRERNQSCAWWIHPSKPLAAIEFRARISSFGGDDYLELHSSGHRMVARFSRNSPMESQLVVRDSNTALLMLVHGSRDTHIDISYTCLEATRLDFFGYDMQVSNFVVIIGIIQVLFCAGIFAYCFAKQELHRRQAFRRALTLATVRQTMEPHAARRDDQREPWFERQLEALPQRKYKDVRGNLDQCCVCLGDFVSEDVLRTLPCVHYFHKDCLDMWFSNQRALAWACPLCKSDALKACLKTVVDVESHGEGP